MARFDTPTKRGRWLLFATVACFTIGVVSGYFMRDDATDESAFPAAVVAHGYAAW